MSEFSLVDRIICAASDARINDVEVLASGIGIGAGLAVGGASCLAGGAG